MPENDPQVNPNAASGWHLSQSKKFLTIAIPTELSTRGFRAGSARARLGLAESAPSRRVSSRLSCPGYNPTDSPRLTCATITPAPIQNTTRWRSQ